MGRYNKVLAAAIALWLALPATALAGPTFAVTIGAPRPVVVVTSPIHRRDEFGRIVWVPGHWSHHAHAKHVVVSRPAVGPRRVVVHQRDGC